jgi:fibronectin type 3 domain-containing protein
MIWISGCNNNPTPLKQEEDPSLPIVSNIKILSTMNKIAFEWLPMEQTEVKGYYIYRNRDNNNSKFYKVATINDRYASHFVDALKLYPNKSYNYKMVAYNKNGMPGPSNQTYTVTTQPLIDSVVWIDKVGHLPHRTKLLWRPHSDLSVSSYIVERNSFSKPKWVKIAKINYRLSAEFIDQNLDSNRIYRYRLRAVTYDNIISKPSKTIEVLTKKLPSNIINVKVSNNLPREIRLDWSEDTLKDAKKYKIYISKHYEGGYYFYRETQDLTFLDSTRGDGEKRFYKITAVDNDNLEGSLDSARIIIGRSLIKPKPPILRSVKIKNSKVVIKFENDDPRSVKYIIIKKTKINWVKNKIQRIKLRKTSYIDSDILPNIEYSYAVKSVDKNGIPSKETNFINVIDKKEVIK